MLNQKVANILSNQDKDVQRSSQLCYTWGRIRYWSDFILLDLGSTHNFIIVELSQWLGISTEEMGLALHALGAFEGQEVPVTPLIGKPHLHIQNYSNIVKNSMSLNL